MATWRYFARRVHGNGFETHLLDLDLADPSRTRQLSAPPGFTALITPEVKELLDTDGRPLLRRWDTAIYAEVDGHIRGGWLLINSTFNGENWELDCAGFSHYATGQPYRGAQYWVGVDPLAMHDHIWEHLQSQPRGNLGVELDDTTSPVRRGTELEEVQFTTGAGEVVNFEAGPYKLNWYQSHDLGKEIDDLAEQTPFDWVEEHSWIGSTEQIRHLIRRGYPRLGRRRHDIGFEIGTNVFTEPTLVERGEDYADVVIVLGAGEGSEMIRGEYGVPFNSGPTRAAVVEDKSIKSKAAAIARAQTEVALRTGALSLDSVEITDHPSARLAGIELGDEVWLTGRAGWVDVAMWVRIVSLTDNPDNGDIMQASVIRADLGIL